ncbi:MAG: MotA/TolQ/ExbB proton channel family protein [Deltaproteobacteria bacterium]|nr:MotA/TolQ/ExbB proton channel family protein [Deltaproteobacteria bacterium]
MQIIGLALLIFVIWFGFRDRTDMVISAFDPHALVMVIVGSFAAVLMSSTTKTALRTFTCLGELVPGIRQFAKGTKRMEQDREQLCLLWQEGKRNAAVEHAERCPSLAIKKMLELIMSRSPEAGSAKVFLELRHNEISHWQPAVHNWEMLSKLGPSFGMVGTITGMITLFRNMSSDNLNIGAAMSLALLATLYGVAFGAGLAGPVNHFLNGLLDDRLGCLERCEKSVNEIVALADR